MTWPEPHQDITGHKRDYNDLLSLRPEAIAVRDIIRTLAYHLWDAVLVGDPAPRVRRMYEFMSATPKIGDLVIEQSTFWSSDEDQRTRGFGFLVATRKEWATTNAEHQAEVDREKAYCAEHNLEYVPDERFTDYAWYVQYGPEPADVCRWHNCSFMVVPFNIESFKIAAGTREDGALVLTRDSLVNALADSGFKFKDEHGA